jgi:hypothetical protein
MFLVSAIVDEAMLQEAAEKLAIYAAHQKRDFWRQGFDSQAVISSRSFSDVLSISLDSTSIVETFLETSSRSVLSNLDLDARARSRLGRFENLARGVLVHVLLATIRTYTGGYAFEHKRRFVSFERHVAVPDVTSPCLQITHFITPMRNFINPSTAIATGIRPRRPVR